MATLNELSIRRWELSPMSEHAFEHLDTLTIEDACYVVLTAGLDTTLLTCDAALSRSRGHDTVIELVPGADHAA